MTEPVPWPATDVVAGAVGAYDLAQDSAPSEAAGQKER